MAYFVGKSASLTVAASARPMDKWQLTLKADPVDTTSFVSSGYATNEAGIFSAEGSFEGPYDNSEGISQGDSIAITFGLGGAGQSFSVTMRITSVAFTTDVKGVARIAFQGTSNGSFAITP